MSSGRIVVPLATGETINNIASHLRGYGYEVYTAPVIGFRRDFKIISRTLKTIKSFKGVIVSIFTSKTAVEIVDDAISGDGELASKVFSNVIAIGPFTSLKVKDVAYKYNINPKVSVPEQHNSNGVIELLKKGLKYVLWCSKHVNTRLKLYVESLNSLVAPIYTPILNIKNIKRLAKILKDYRFRYFIFTSGMSVKAWKFMLRSSLFLTTGWNYAIVLSGRIASKLDYTYFREVYIYNSHDISEFIKFMNKVIL